MVFLLLHLVSPPSQSPYIRRQLLQSRYKLLLRPGRGAKYRDQSVCLSVCVCLRAYLWNRWTDLHEIFCADPQWPWLGPLLAVLRYVIMHFRFCGWRHVWSKLAVVGRMARLPLTALRYRGGVWCLWMFCWWVRQFWARHNTAILTYVFSSRKQLWNLLAYV